MCLKEGPGSGGVNHTTENLQDCNTSPEPLPTGPPGSTTSCCCELTALPGGQHCKVSVEQDRTAAERVCVRECV